MPRQFLTPIDLVKNELRNARIQNLASAPSSPVDGQIYFDTTTKAFRFYDGDEWVDVISQEGLITQVNVDEPLTSTGGASPTLGINEATTSVKGALSAADKTKLDGIESGATANDTDANLRDRSTHTGTQPLNTITGHDKAAHDALAIDAASVGGNTPANLRDRSTHTGSQAISTVTGLQGALDDKIDTSEKGANNGVATLDGSGKVPNAQIPPLAITETYVVADLAARDALTVQEGDVAIVQSESQSYIYDGADWQELLSPTDGVQDVTASTPLSSSGGSTPDISLDNDGINTQHLADDAVTEVKLHPDVQTKLNAPGGALKFAQTIGNGSLTSFAITHNLDTRDVAVAVYQAASPWEEVEVGVERTTVNIVTVSFAVAPAADEYRVVVVG